MEAWKTKSKWLHWDLSPFHWVAGTITPYSFVSENNCTALEPGARCRVQGLLNLIDARTEDGGFLCVPGFHKHLLEWAAAAENQPYKEETVDAFDFLEVPKDDPMQAWTQPVPMRAGSLLIWNSAMNLRSHSLAQTNRYDRRILPDNGCRGVKQIIRHKTACICLLSHCARLRQAFCLLARKSAAGRARTLLPAQQPKPTALTATDDRSGPLTNHYSCTRNM
jgi:hypothetical protein